jgi:hypothetical protein
MLDELLFQRWVCRLRHFYVFYAVEKLLKLLDR